MRKFYTLLLLVYCCTPVLSQPPVGYYNSATGKSCKELKTALKSIISVMSPQGYSSLWNQYTLTDVKAREVGTGSATVIYDIYSSVPGPANDPYNFTPGTGPGGQQDHGTGGNTEGEFYNREHSIPLSWFSGSTSPGPGTDYNHIFPTDKKINGLRGNMPYGEVGNATFTSRNGSRIGASSIAGISGTVFEPIDSFKGDVARAFFYFVTRYQDDMPTYGNNSEARVAFEPNTYPSIDIPFLQMMIRWHHLDAVSEKEQNRNNGAYSFQQNRNPYIDHPEFVDQVWQNTCVGLETLPLDQITLTGRILNGNVLLQWKVESEEQLQQFQVERSYNGNKFTAISTISVSGNKMYQFNDASETNRGRRVFYRLKVIRKDAEVKYSRILNIHLPLNNKFSVYPNPIHSSLHVKVNSSTAGNATFSITDLQGKTLFLKALRIDGNDLDFDNLELAKGTYVLKIIVNGEQFNERVVVQ